MSGSAEEAEMAEMAAAPRGATVRTLPVAEWPRLLVHEPFASGGLPDPTFWQMLVAEVDGQIVGFVGLWTAVHCEPVWFDAAYRHHPKLFLDLWRAARTTVEATGGQMVFATVDDDRADLQALWQRFGFVRAPGRLYVGDLAGMPT